MHSIQQYFIEHTEKEELLHRQYSRKKKRFLYLHCSLDFIHLSLEKHSTISCIASSIKKDTSITWNFNYFPQFEWLRSQWLMIHVTISKVILNSIFQGNGSGTLHTSKAISFKSYFNFLIDGIPLSVFELSCNMKSMYNNKESSVFSS